MRLASLAHRLVGLVPAILLAGSSARAVVMYPSGGIDNTLAPSGAANWDHVGLVNGSGIPPGSGVYIGNRWVLTANHVEGGNTNQIDSQGQYHLPVFTLPGRGSYTAIFGSAVRLGSADLTLFRLGTDPGLAPVPMGTAPALGSTVTFAGFGWSAGAGKNWWLDKPNDPVNAVWSSTGSGWNSMSGSVYDSNSDPSTRPIRRWGKNVTVDADLDSSTGQNATSFFQSSVGNTWIFTTQFDPVGIPGEAQAAESDSGGGVFLGNRLVGVTLYTWTWKNYSNSTLGQPMNSAVFYNATSFADLTTYVDDIARTTQVAPGLLGDANLDGIVNKADFRILRQNLGTGTKWSQGDFNLDGVVDLRDLQILELNFGARSAAAAPIPGDIASVPEPIGLAGAGLAIVCLMRRKARNG